MIFCVFDVICLVCTILKIKQGTGDGGRGQGMVSWCFTPSQPVRLCQGEPGNGALMEVWKYEVYTNSNKNLLKNVKKIKVIRLNLIKSLTVFDCFKHSLFLFQKHVSVHSHFLQILLQFPNVDVFVLNLRMAKVKKMTRCNIQQPNTQRQHAVTCSKQDNEMPGYPAAVV